MFSSLQKVTYTVGNTTEYGEWREFLPKAGLSPPECIDNLWSRDNHLGNGVGGNPNHFNWTIPDLPHEHCVFRARYNISTAEYNAWDGSVNSSLNRQRGNSYSELDVWSQFDFTREEGIEVSLRATRTSVWTPQYITHCSGCNTSVQYTLQLVLHFSTVHTAVGATLQYSTHCSWCYTSVQYTLQLVLHFSTVHTAVGATLQYITHCSWCYTSVQYTLQLVLHFSTVHTAVGATLQYSTHCSWCYTSVQYTLQWLQHLVQYTLQWLQHLVQYTLQWLQHFSTLQLLLTSISLRYPCRENTSLRITPKLKSST